MPPPKASRPESENGSGRLAFVSRIRHILIMGDVVRHIRLTNANVRDRRFRTLIYTNKLRPVLCGAAPTHDDWSRAEALRIRESSRIIPKWLDDVCPVCLAALEACVSASSPHSG